MKGYISFFVLDKIDKGSIPSSVNPALDLLSLSHQIPYSAFTLNLCSASSSCSFRVMIFLLVAALPEGTGFSAGTIFRPLYIQGVGMGEVKG